MADLVALSVPQANDVILDLAVLGQDGSAQDCSGLSPVMVIKPCRYGDDHAVQLTLGSGLLWVSQPAGTLTAAVGHAVLAGSGTLWWRLDLDDGQGNRTTAMYGPLTIIPV